MRPRNKKRMPFSYYVGVCIMKVLMLLLIRWRVYGKENVPREGPLIIVSNHLHNADPPLLSAVMPRGIVFMAKEELFRNRLGRIVVIGFGAFQVSRRRYDREALRRASEVLQQGLALGLFPEGRRSKAAQLQEAFPGTALVAWQAKCPIVPVGIVGTEKIKGFFLFLRRPVVTVRIGSPFEIPTSNGQPSKPELKASADMIMTRIAELLPQGYRGVYGDAVGKGE